MNNKCVAFGEVLFDVLPHEKKVGGAPLNVTYHLQKMQKPTVLISRIGNDKNGKELKSFMQKRNINTNFLQIDNIHTTGVVIAEANERGEMSYDIKENMAWDYIEINKEHENLLKEAHYFIYGSLASRNVISRKTLFELMDIPCKKVFDINLRAPFINKKNIEYQLEKTNILKMNIDELDFITSWFYKAKTLEDKMRFIKDKFLLDILLVTRGADGATMLHEDNFLAQDGIKVEVADTIGSGDSFLAGVLSALMENESPEKALEFAGKLGALVTSKTGGCPEYSINEIREIGQKEQFA